MAFFSFNGVTKDYVRVLRGLERPAWAPIEHEILEIPGRPGGLITGKKIKIRQINIPVRVYTKGFESLQKVKEDLAAWLITDEPKELIFSDEPDRVYYAQVTGELNLDELVEWGEGVISFICPDPFKYGPLRTQTINVPPASFSRNSVAYLSDGTQVAANQPRLENGGVLIEEGTTNLLLNPSFETDSNSDGLADQWSIGVRGIGDSNRTHAVSRVPSLFHGLYAQRVEITGGVTNSQPTRLSSQKVNITPGSVYVATAYVKASVADKVVIALVWEDSSSQYISESISSKKAGTSVTRITVTGTAPPNAARVAIYIQGINQIGEWFEVDAAQLEQKPYATSFVDGTRQPETLTVPTAGMNPKEWTIEFWAYLQGDLLASVPTRYITLFATATQHYTHNVIEFSRAGNQTNIWFFRTTNGSAVSSSANGVWSPTQGWHYFALRANTSASGFFIDGQKIAEINTPTLPDVLNAVASLGYALWNSTQYSNTIIGPLRLSRIARSDAEIMDAYQNGFTVDEYTTAYLPFDGSLEVQTPTIVNNEGTAETYPTFTAYVKQPITFLDIISPDSYMRVGQPYEVSQTPVDGDKPVMQDKMTTTTGWGAASSVVDGIVQGTMVSDGERFVVQSYGPSYNGWAGPALKKSLPYAVQDFRMYSLIQIHSSAKGTGRIEIYGLDTANNIIFRTAIADYWPNAQLVRAHVELGPNVDMIWNTYGKKKGALNYYYGAIDIRRKGNRWEFYTARVNNEGNLVDFVRHTFTDTKNKYTAPLAQIQVHIGCHLSYGPVDHMSINHLYVYELRDHQENEVPYIAYPDDILQFDHKNAVIYRNGEPIMSQKDFGARFFSLAPGETELSVNPSDAAVVTIDYRPRYK